MAAMYRLGGRSSSENADKFAARAEGSGFRQAANIDSFSRRRRFVPDVQRFMPCEDGKGDGPVAAALKATVLFSEGFGSHHRRIGTDASVLLKSQSGRAGLYQRNSMARH